MEAAAIRNYYAAIAPLYDAELADRNDVDFWRTLLEAWKPLRTVEYGCGSGRISVPLALHQARWDAQFWGVELVPAMLRRARRRWAQERREAPPQALHFCWGDMRRFLPEAPVDLALFPDDPLTHLPGDEDLAATFRQVGQQLRPGGRLVVEVSLLPPQARGQQKQVQIAERHGFASPQGWIEVEQQRQIDPTRSAAQVWYRYYADAVPLAEASFTAHYLDLGQITGLFRLAGCRVEERWADFHYSPLRRDSTMAIVTGARR